MVKFWEGLAWAKNPRTTEPKEEFSETEKLTGRNCAHAIKNTKIHARRESKREWNTLEHNSKTH